MRTIAGKRWQQKKWVQTKPRAKPTANGSTKVKAGEKGNAEATHHAASTTAEMPGDAAGPSSSLSPLSKVTPTTCARTSIVYEHPTPNNAQQAVDTAATTTAVATPSTSSSGLKRKADKQLAYNKSVVVGSSSTSTKAAGVSTNVLPSHNSSSHSL